MSENIETDSQILHKKKIFIERLKFLYNYKYTIFFVSIILIPYYSIILIWGYFNDITFFTSMLKDPQMYFLFPFSIHLCICDMIISYNTYLRETGAFLCKVTIKYKPFFLQCPQSLSLAKLALGVSMPNIANGFSLHWKNQRQPGAVFKGCLLRFWPWFNHWSQEAHFGINLRGEICALKMSEPAIGD